MNLEQLKRGEKKVGVWGTGYIGFTTMANFAKNGVQCIGYDISEKIVNTINSGKPPVPNLEYWLGFDVEPLVRAGLIKATTNLEEIINKDVIVHFIAVPTEKNDEPWDDALIDVTQKLCRIKEFNTDPPLVIIESTLTPYRTDNVVIPILEKAGLKVGKDIYVGVAPRRDWFISPEKNLKVLPRVFGGTTKETTELMRNVLSLICDNLVPAPDHRHAEIVKGIENAYRHMEITLANQLSLAYPDLDMTEILRLVGTKWNMGTYYPSFGTGGYCIPLASKYVISGTKYPQNLTLLNETIKFDSKMPIIVAESLIKRGAKNVGILGLAYKGDLKVHILSPTIKIVRLLKERGVNVKVHDPYYTEEEIKKIVDVETFSYPEGLKEFDTILIVAGHLLYKSTPEKVLIENLKNCRLILDNLEKAWRRIDFSKYGIKYYVAGESGWLVTS